MLIFHSYSELNIWQTSSWHIPPSNGNFTDSCSDCSYFFPTLSVQHLVDQVLAYLTPLKYQFHRFFPYSESSYLADQVLEELPSFQKAISQICALLWEHIFGRKVFTNQPTLSNGNFTDSCFESLYSFPTLRAQHLADQFFAGRCTIKSQFHRFLLYSGSSYLADQVLANLPSLSNGNFTDSCSTLRVHIWQTKCWQIYPSFEKAISQIPALTAHISFLLWELNILAGLGLAHLYLFEMAISQIPTLTAHISFLPWELNIWQTRSWEIYPLLMAVLQIPALTAHISFLL